MDIIQTYPLYALIACNAALATGVAIALLRFQRLIKENREFWESPTAMSMRESNDPDTVLAGFLERRLAIMHQRLNELSEKLDAGTAAPQPSVELPFAYAKRMAKNGASIDDLVDACGLKRDEATLMRRLHTRRSDDEHLASQ